MDQIIKFQSSSFCGNIICLKEFLCDPDHMIKLEFYAFVVCVEIDNQATVHVGRSEDNLQESVPSFHHVGLRDQAQVIRLGGKHLYSLSHLTDLWVAFILRQGLIMLPRLAWDSPRSALSLLLNCWGWGGGLDSGVFL